MIRHAARAVPWGLVAVGCALVPVLMAIAAAWPQAMWPLQGTAVGLLAAVAAWSMDERAAAVVDASPRPLWWRTGARSTSAVALLGVWIACLAVAADRLPDHAGLFALQGVAAVAAGAAVATLRRARGAATPGLVMAPAAVAIVATLALVRPAHDHVPLFPIWPGERWGLSAVIWWTVLGCAGLLMAAALRGRGVAAPAIRWRRGRSPASPASRRRGAGPYAV